MDKCAIGIYFLVSGWLSSVNEQNSDGSLASLVPLAPCLTWTVLFPVKSGDAVLYEVQGAFFELSDRFEGNGLRWDYSLDGKTKWTEVASTADNHKHMLTEKEIASNWMIINGFTSCCRTLQRKSVCHMVWRFPSIAFGAQNGRFLSTD